jgi:large subunit ribosomal protein L5
MSRLKDKYVKDVVPALQKRFGYKNIMEVPHLEKIVLNMGLGEAKDNARALDSAVAELALISGQKPMVTKARCTRWRSARSKP